MIIKKKVETEQEEQTSHYSVWRVMEVIDASGLRCSELHLNVASLKLWFFYLSFFTH